MHVTSRSSIFIRVPASATAVSSRPDTFSMIDTRDKCRTTAASVSRVFPVSDPRAYPWVCSFSLQYYSTGPNRKLKKKDRKRRLATPVSAHEKRQMNMRKSSSLFLKFLLFVSVCYFNWFCLFFSFCCLPCTNTSLKTKEIDYTRFIGSW